jgi:hypothetical protein
MPEALALPSAKNGPRQLQLLNKLLTAAAAAVALLGLGLYDINYKHRYHI